MDMRGTISTVDAKELSEVRMLDCTTQTVRLEFNYKNGEYSMVETQAFQLRGSDEEEFTQVRFVRGTRSDMRFPKIR